MQLNNIKKMVRVVEILDEGKNTKSLESVKNCLTILELSTNKSALSKFVLYNMLKRLNKDNNLEFRGKQSVLVNLK